MENVLTEITNYVLRQSWQIAVVFALVAAACWALRKASAHWRYLLWLVVLAKCVVPPLVGLPVAVLPVEADRAAPAAPAEPAPAPPAAPETADAGPAPCCRSCGGRNSTVRTRHLC